MKKQELYDRVIAYFEQAMPVAETEQSYFPPNVRTNGST